MFRIGEISYLNCTPLFSALRSSYHDDCYSFVAGHPAVLNEKLRQGEIDLCPSSSIEYARNPELYRILPNLSISSDGEVQSVLLFSRQPIESLDGVSIGLTGESETSIILLKILLLLRYSLTNSFYQLTAKDGEAARHTALLLIGDKALSESSKSQWDYVYDLGTLWNEFTGLPFVFALWLLRQDALERSPEVAHMVHARVVNSKKVALDSIEVIALTTGQNIWTDSANLINYWHVISYDLTARHIAGLELFYHYAWKCGFIGAEPSLRLLEGDCK